MWIIVDTSFAYSSLEIVAMFHDRNTAESWAKKYKGPTLVYFDSFAVFFKMVPVTEG